MTGQILLSRDVKGTHSIDNSGYDRISGYLAMVSGILLDMVMIVIMIIVIVKYKYSILFHPFIKCPVLHWTIRSLIN